ncbi:SAM-dependent methyltransferase [Actinoplanes sp. CA-131856]
MTGHPSNKRSPRRTAVPSTSPNRRRSCATGTTIAATRAQSSTAAGSSDATRAADDSDDLSGFDTKKPTSARVFNYWLGGKDNFTADRDCSAILTAAVPDLPADAKASYAFTRRAVRYLVAGAGIRQILDIGCGMPSHLHVHEVAQQITPSCRIVYVDNDPLVAAYARALMTSGTRQGVIHVEQADLLAPDLLLAAVNASNVLDLSQPVAVLLTAVLPHCADFHQLNAALHTLIGGLAPGSHLAISHATADGLSKTVRDRYAAARAKTGLQPYAPRSRAEIAGLLNGLDLVYPGLVTTNRWKPKLGPTPAEPAAGLSYAAVARLP